MKTTFKLKAILIFTALLHSCGDVLDGTYVGVEGAFFKEMTFTSVEKVELVFMGSTAEGSYTIEGNRVKIVTTGGNQILTITDDECLDGGGLVGTYCKEL